jgi:uncharacterized protein (DUF1800 family)
LPSAAAAVAATAAAATAAADTTEADATASRKRAKVAARNGLTTPAGDALRAEFAGKSLDELGPGALNADSRAAYARFGAKFMQAFKDEHDLATKEDIINLYNDDVTRDKFVRTTKGVMLRVAQASITGSATPLTHLSAFVLDMFGVRGVDFSFATRTTALHNFPAE